MTNGLECTELQLGYLKNQFVGTQLPVLMRVLAANLVGFQRYQEHSVTPCSKVQNKNVQPELKVAQCSEPKFTKKSHRIHQGPSAIIDPKLCSGSSMRGWSSDEFGRRALRKHSNLFWSKKLHNVCCLRLEFSMATASATLERNRSASQMSRTHVLSL